ncbi:MAG: response regulator, partial [Methylophilaceae bacterium]|nr:response regulator [Methylophilaceae bacterium]
VIVDITAQTEAQEALQVSIAEQEAIFNSAPLGIALFRNRIMASSNQRWEQIIGYSQQEMVGQSNKAWFLDEESHGLLGRLAYPLMGRGETYRGEWLLKRKDGSQFWCRMSGHAIDPEDAIGGSVWQFEDITAERDAAEELMKAKDIAEEATHAKSMFLANMSHEIRTPLNAIIGLAHLTLKTSLSVKQHDYVSKMHNAGVSLLSIINDILDFSKIEAGRIDLENTQFSLDEVVDHLTTGLGTASMENKLEILFDISADVPALVMGDKLRLGQVLLNLVGNAVKFTEQGEVIVRAESLERTNDRIKLLFTVNDTGIGMSPAEVSKLFQPFTQADCTTTRKYGGTGLGLTISKRLVELMGGNIWVNSEMGKGSTFSFTAWFGLAENKRRARLVPEELNGLKVLIVDDNVAARTILAGQLAFLPLEIDQVTSGQEAIEAVNQSQSSKPIDLILMDWNMPRLNGMETARKIKQDQSLKKIPLIIMVTAFGHDDVRREAEALNLDGFLIKPVNQSTLVDMLVTLYAPSSNAVVNRRKGDQHAATYDLSSMRILVVEDNEINQQIARELLESVGANVEVASDGRECVDKLMHQDKKYDVVLMDLQMPVMDGYAATIMIRQNPDLAQLPIIAMTAHAAADARERCLEVGMNGHVAKPIDPDVLYQTLSHYMPNTDKVSPRNTAKKAKAKPIADDAILNLLNGIDVATGLKRVAGNQKLYISLLEQFVSGYADSDKQILLALESNKRDDAQRLAHSVKGVAGNIGANALSQSAAEIERILREGGEHHQAVLGYQKELKKTLKIINKAISKQSVKKRLTGQGDVGKVETKLKILLKYVKSSDARSQDYWVEHQDVFEQHLASESYETLRQAIHGFDFEVAHDEIEVILASQSGTK